jgi:uncharacterized membrane protein YedE/YeeE
MNILTALFAGLVFGLGLIVSGMSNPAKVLGFLDLAGRWDPSLALVMAGAILAAAPAFALARRRKASLLGEPMRLPAAGAIDRRLALGALAFGAGWGLAGISAKIRFLFFFGAVSDSSPERLCLVACPHGASHWSCQ